MNTTDRSNSTHLTKTATRSIKSTANRVVDFSERIFHLGEGFRSGLIVLTICAGNANVLLAQTISNTKQAPPSVVYRYYLDTRSGYFAGGIKDPYHPQEYIRQLATKLGEKGAKNLLPEGLDISPTKRGGPKQTCHF